MRVYPTTMVIVKDGFNQMTVTDVVEIKGSLWAVLEWNAHNEPLIKVALNRHYWEDMKDGTWLYQMPVVWPGLGEAAG